MNRSLILATCILAACEAGIAGNNGQGGGSAGNGSGPGSGAGPGGVGGGGEGGGTSQCSQGAQGIVPLFQAGASQTGPIVVKRADGVIVTTGAGRVRPRHEREDRFMHFESHYFEHRSFKFTIEDHVAAGRSSIKVTYEPIADPSPNGPTTNFRAWKVYGTQGNGPDHYTFADNGVLTAVETRKLEKTVTRNARANRAIQVGDIFDFEFGIFITGFNSADPVSIGDGAKSYYSDTFRYQVGSGGLTPETFDDTGLLGPTLSTARLGGALTVPHIATADGTASEPEMAFSQMALNMQGPHQQTWLEGRRLFHTRFDTGAHSEPGNPAFTEQAGKLGPHFNVTSCVACHAHNGRGVLPQVGGRVDSLVLKLTDEGSLGTQLQLQEAELKLASWETKEVELSGGEKVTLKRPVFDAGRPLKASPRIARQLVGMGLLEAIDENTLLARADENDCDKNGVSGRARLVNDPVTGQPRLGRFGWKAEKVSVKHQVADAADADLGVQTSVMNGVAELADADLERLTVYMQLLGVLPQRNAGSAQVQRGEVVFKAIGCSKCHVPETTTGDTHPFEELRAQTIRPFSDLLLHDMGADLTDASGKDDASEWRTPPLWGVGFTRQISGAVHLLHDGRAGSVLEAALWHGGEAAPMRASLVAMSKEDRDALVAFVESL